MSLRFVTAKMEQDMIGRIEKFAKDNGIGLFSDAVMQYIIMLEKASYAAPVKVISEF